MMLACERYICTQDNIRALFHQLEAATTSVEASKQMRPVAKFNFMVVDV